MSRMIFYKPAKNWFQALPAGNGKTAVMIHGGKKREYIDFNDCELWSGGPHNYDNPESLTALPEVRRLVFEKKYAEAHDLVENKCQGNYTEAFMPLGRACLEFNRSSGGYKRTLDMDEGVIKIEDKDIKRLSFVSHTHQTAVYSVTAKSAFSIRISLSSKLNSSICVENGIMTVYGNAPDYAAPHYLKDETNPIRYDKGKGMGFCLASKAVTDGEITADAQFLAIENATYAHIYFKTETGFKSFNEVPDSDAEGVKLRAVEKLSALNADFEEIFAEHKKDYGNLRNRNSLILQNGDGNVARLRRNAKFGKLSAGLINILYDYGKYLTVCGSRGSQPLNLQGQWNSSLRPPWSSNLTVNINTEMNYWGASQVGLHECIEPFYNAVKEISIRGKETAKTNYGARGYCCNHNVDIWRNTSTVQGNPMYMFAPLCGAWLTNEAYYHKKNSGAIDGETLDIISENARFLLDYLTEYDGYLTVCPSVSPEATFTHDGRQCAVGHSSAFELSLIRQSFANCLENDIDTALRQEIETALSRLHPLSEAENGLAEWGDGKRASERGHRHFSPLYGVYPGNVVKKGSEEFELSRKLFYDRQANAHSSIGWSAVWGICLAACFEDDKTAEKILKGFCAKSIMKNLFDFHPPCFFQIDGNLGFIAAINRLLISENDGVIGFLPACPKLLSSGKMRGIVINGNRINFDWADGKVTYIEAEKNIRVKDMNIDENAKLINVTRL